MAQPLIDRVSTQTLMMIVLFFSYIYDSLQETYLVLPEAASNQPTVEATASSAKSKRQHQPRISLSQSCLVKMPTILRLYAYFSTLAHILITSKYIALSLVKYKFIPNREEFACYLPGRVSFLADLAYELPGLAIMMSGSHLVWRSFWYIFFRRLHLESLLFLVCEDDSIRDMRQRLRRKFPKLQPKQQHQLYELNRLFCQRIQTTSGQTEYLLRKDRDLRRKRSLDDLIRLISVILLMNTILFGTPLVIVMLLNLLSHDYFDLNYQECRSFSMAYTQNNNLTSVANFSWGQLWSFYDPYRVLMLLVDGFDNFMILFDSACGLTWPMVTTTIVGIDLTLSMDDISRRISLIVDSLLLAERDIREQANGSIKNILECSIELNRVISSSSRQVSGNSKSDSRHLDALEAIELEILILQSDIMLVFDQVQKVDRFINAFAAYAIIFWVTINVTYEVLYVSRRQVFELNNTAAFLQLAAFILITFAFFHLGRTHNTTVRLYHSCCRLMAQDPFVKTTKRSWIWILEYYEPQKSLYSLHMGWTVLTFINYIKFMLYSITFSIVLINLLQQELY